MAWPKNLSVIPESERLLDGCLDAFLELRPVPHAGELEADLQDVGGDFRWFFLVTGEGLVVEDCVGDDVLFVLPQLFLGRSPRDFLVFLRGKQLHHLVELLLGLLVLVLLLVLLVLLVLVLVLVQGRRRRVVGVGVVMVWLVVTKMHLKILVKYYRIKSGICLNIIDL